MPDAKVKYGVFHGRFQPFHNGHMKAVMMCLERCEILYIGLRMVGNDFGAFDLGQMKKSAEENPFTFDERMRMVKESLMDAEVDLKRVNIVPFPLENPDKWYEYVPRGTAHFRIGVSDWDEGKIKAFQSAGLQVETLPIYEKDISAEDVRKRILENKNWKELVPKGTARVIEEIDGVNRIKTFMLNRSW